MPDLSGANRLDDLLTMLARDPEDRPYLEELVVQALARAVLDPVLAARDDELRQLREQIAAICALCDDTWSGAGGYMDLTVKVWRIHRVLRKETDHGQ